MSQITTVAAALISLVGTALPSHKRLQNPYHLEDNPEPLLKQGWGIRVDEGLNTKRQISQPYFLARTFSVVLTREALAVASDPATRETAMLGLLEDLHALISTTFTDMTLGGSGFDFRYDSDGGYQEVFSEEKPYFYIEAKFVVEYSQSVSGG